MTIKSETKVYGVWEAMKQRCLNPRCSSYKNYGGRGINICEEWMKFDGFYKDMGDPPNGHTIERIDNDKGYFKENCRWVDWRTNLLNRRNNRRLTYNGKTQTMSEWAEEIGIRQNTIATRLHRGWSTEMALSKTRKKKPAPVKTLKNKLWKLVSEYVRRKDADPHTGMVECYTCGTVKHWREGDAGHGIPGRKNMVLFDLSILRFQCKNCNRNQGEQYTFGKKLNAENGDGWFEEKLIESKRPKKYYIADYEEMIEDMKQKLKDLEV